MGLTRYALVLGHLAVPLEFVAQRLSHQVVDNIPRARSSDLPALLLRLVSSQRLRLVLHDCTFAFSCPCFPSMGQLVDQGQDPTGVGATGSSLAAASSLVFVDGVFEMQPIYSGCMSEGEILWEVLTMFLFR